MRMEESELYLAGQACPTPDRDDRDSWRAYLLALQSLDERTGGGATPAETRARVLPVVLAEYRDRFPEAAAERITEIFGAGAVAGG